MAATWASSSGADDEENSPESLKKSKSSEYKRCYMHIASVKHEKMQDFTITRWNTYRNSLQQWLKLRGECRDVADTYKHCLDLDFENAAFHLTCSWRFIDKCAIAKAERRLVREREREERIRKAAQQARSFHQHRVRQVRKRNFDPA